MIDSNNFNLQTDLSSVKTTGMVDISSPVVVEEKDEEGTISVYLDDGDKVLELMPGEMIQIGQEEFQKMLNAIKDTTTIDSRFRDATVENLYNADPMAAIEFLQKDCLQKDLYIRQLEAAVLYYQAQEKKE